MLIDPRKRGRITGSRTATVVPTPFSLFTAIDPVRVLDTRGVSPLGNAVPLHPHGGVAVELAASELEGIANDFGAERIVLGREPRVAEQNAATLAAEVMAATRSLIGVTIGRRFSRR